MRKRNVSFIMAICVMLNLSTVALAAESEYKSMMDDAETRQKILASAYADNVAPNYISVDEYLTKYGTTNVIKGFNKAEIDHKANVLKTANAAEKASLNKDIASFSSEPNDLYLSITEGEFLGLDIVGISDLSPDNTKLSFKLKKEGINDNNGISPAAVVPYSNYTVYYKDYAPGQIDLNNAYEPNSGTYMYKYSLAFENNYLCESDVVFNNTKLYCGTQQNNMYTYIAAKSQQLTLDFGLMANPKDSIRNKGMYACYNNGNDEDFFVEAYPKVNIVGTSTSPMTLENKTVKLRLSIGNETAELYMESGGSCIFYMVLDDTIVPSLISGSPTTNPLTFMTAISCVGLPSSTNLSSGSYYKNVKMQNSKLYNYNGSVYPFTTMGDHTYYTFICKPQTATFSYGNNWETMSIVYNN